MAPRDRIPRPIGKRPDCDKSLASIDCHRYYGTLVSVSVLPSLQTSHAQDNPLQTPHLTSLPTHSSKRTEILRSQKREGQISVFNHPQSLPRHTLLNKLGQTYKPCLLCARNERIALASSNANFGFGTCARIRLDLDRARGAVELSEAAFHWHSILRRASRER
jgi:hypothetical protein